VAYFAPLYLVPHGRYGTDKTIDILFGLTKQIQHQPKRRSAPNAWKFGKLVHRIFQ
jgi:hypothetical protein